MAGMFSPLIDIPPDYYRAIGEIAARWNWLENQLGVLIREGFKLNKEEGRVLTTGMQMKPKSHVLRIMAKTWITDPATRHDLIALAKSCQTMIDDRNHYVHGLYGCMTTDRNVIGIMIARSGEQRITPDFAATLVSELQQCASDLKFLQDTAQALTQRVKAWRKKP